MSSRKGRRVGNWRTPPGRLMRCALNVLIKQRRERAWVVAEFKRLFPDYQHFHVNPVGDGAIWNRAVIGTRAGYEAEHPDKNPAIAIYMGAARKVIAEGEPVSVGEIEDLCEYVALGGRYDETDEYDYKAGEPVVPEIIGFTEPVVPFPSLAPVPVPSNGFRALLWRTSVLCRRQRHR